MKYSFLLILLVSCTPSKYDSHQSGYKPKGYTPFVPIGYELIIERGIDSYVGTVKNDSISFNFDYGMYSSRGPLGKVSLREMLKYEHHLKAIKTSCDFDKFSNKRIGNGLQVDSVFYASLINDESQRKVIIRLRVEDVKCEYETSPLQSNMVEGFYQNSFIDKEDKDFTLKIFYPKSDSLNYAGIYITRKNDRKRLSYYTMDYAKQYHDEILEILSEVGEDYVSQI